MPAATHRRRADRAIEEYKKTASLRQNDLMFHQVATNIAKTEERANSNVATVDF